MSEFISALKKFVHRETDEQLKQIRSIWGESVEKRVAEGEAIADLKAVEISPMRAVFEFKQNLSKFRPGDELRLNCGNPFEKPYIACMLEDESETSITLVPGYQESFWGLDTRLPWTLDRQTVDVRHILLGVLQDLELNSHLRECFIIGLSL